MPVTTDIRYVLDVCLLPHNTRACNDAPDLPLICMHIYSNHLQVSDLCFCHAYRVALLSQLTSDDIQRLDNMFPRTIDDT
jgi:hypothetical protein